jgi:ribonuclease HI
MDHAQIMAVKTPKQAWVFVLDLMICATFSKRVVGKHSNNTAELGANYRSVSRIIEKDVIAGKKVGVVSDSNYAILASTTYGEACNAKGWKKDIPNKEMVQLAYSLYKDKPNIKFIQGEGPYTWDRSSFCGG